MRAAIRIGGLTEEAGLYGLLDAESNPVCYGVVTRRSPVVDPDMLLLAFQNGADGGFMQEILEDRRITLHPLPGHESQAYRAGELCELLDLTLLGEGFPDSRTGVIELMVGPIIDGTEDQIAGMTDRFYQENTAGNIVSLFSRRYTDIASS